MDAGLAWTIVGSVAGVAAVAAAVVFGILQLRQARESADLPAGGDLARVSGQASEAASRGQPVLPGKGNEQVNQFIQTYIKDLHVPSPPVTGSLVVGEIPQRAPAFQFREDLVAALSAGGVTVVRAVTGMRGVGKTQIAAAYARSCIDAG